MLTGSSLRMSYPRGRLSPNRPGGDAYRAFRTGLTFRDVYHLIYGRRWKRRNGVLGYWHELKLAMWQEHQERCRH